MNSVLPKTYYGYTVIRSELAVHLACEPQTRWQKFWYEAQEYWYFVVEPAAIFALSVTCFVWAFK